MKADEKRRLGRSNVELTRVGFGGAPLGNLFRAVAETDALAAVTCAYDGGIRYFDTAPLYGHGISEQRIGSVLGARPRDSFVLSTKVGRLLRPPTGPLADDGYVATPPLAVVYDYSRDGALRSIEESLKRLKLARIDIALIHDIDRFTHGEEGQKRRFAEAMDGAYRALDDLRRAGTIRAVGLGVNETRACEQAAAQGDFDCFLLAGRYSLLDQQALDGLLPMCERRGIGLIIGGVFNSGILATGAMPGATYDYKPASEAMRARVQRLDVVCAAHGVKLAAAALQFPFGHRAVTSVIPGARTPAEVESNLALLGQAIPAALWRDLKAERLLRDDAPVP